MAQAALRDEPGRSGGGWGPCSAENTPNARVLFLLVSVQRLQTFREDSQGNGAHASGRRPAWLMPNACCEAAAPPAAAAGLAAGSSQAQRPASSLTAPAAESRRPTDKNAKVHNRTFKKTKNWVREGSLAGYFSARLPLVFRPGPTPGTPSDRRGPPGTSLSTKNQNSFRYPNEKHGPSGRFHKFQLEKNKNLRQTRTHTCLGRRGLAFSSCMC